VVLWGLNSYLTPRSKNTPLGNLPKNEKTHIYVQL
jgi:hypothetical protein